MLILNVPQYLLQSEEEDFKRNHALSPCDHNGHTPSTVIIRFMAEPSSLIIAIYSYLPALRSSVQKNMFKEIKHFAIYDPYGHALLNKNPFPGVFSRAFVAYNCYSHCLPDP